MAKNERVGLLSLPLEIRRAIFLHVLRCGRAQEPGLTKEFVEGRVRLRNCFDNEHPEISNIYVQKHNYSYIHGNGLLATCRQLRSDVTTLIDDTLKRGCEDVSFVLDVMIVKDVGVLPTWMHYPYTPERLKNLRINVRIVRPGRGIIPTDWYQAAQYNLDECDIMNASPSAWNIFVVFVVYAMSRFRMTPLLSQEATTAGDVNHGLSPDTQKSSSRRQSDAQNDAKTQIMDAHLRMSPVYTVDEMYIDWRPFEHRPGGEVIFPVEDDPWKESEHYVEGYCQFLRDFLYEPLQHHIYYGDPAPDKALVALRRASMACQQVEESMWWLFKRMRQGTEAHMDKYMSLLAKNVGVVKTSNYCGEEQIFVGGEPGGWPHIIPNSEFYAFDHVARDLQREEEKPDPDMRLLEALRTAKRRIDLGWWDEQVYRSAQQVERYIDTSG